MHMNKKELIRFTKELLKNVLVLKVDPALDIEKKFELRRLSAALKKLPSADKMLIAYRYFENKAYPEIAKLLFMDITTVRRKLDNITLEVGRKVYGMEQEFWDAIHGENYYNELEKMFYNRIVGAITRKLDEEFM
ncbi:sigma factor-like helix-turn-helix DNA-binding protein [Clostridium sp.]|uniref:RNA polymerase sigma factor n=1 Tax=Clostridium sp. TaxID=1506 RepID=UPI00285292BE|nr:sigma factor-like helix-turn-helix DNA-binding protein [Clostridium sp.]